MPDPGRRDGLRAADEALEDPVALVFGDDRPDVADDEVHGRRHRGIELDDGTGRRVLQRIVDELAQRQPQQVGVGVDHQPGGDPVRHRPPRQPRAELADHAVDEPVEVVPLRPHVEIARLDVEHLDRVADQALQACRLLVDDGQQLAGVVRRHQVGETAGGGPDRRQRRLELVRHRIEERGAQLAAAAGRFGRRGRLALARPLQADGGQVGHRLQHRVAHRAALQARGCRSASGRAGPP